MWNFKGNLWNSTQNIFHIHWQRNIFFKYWKFRSSQNYKLVNVFWTPPPDPTLEPQTLWTDHSTVTYLNCVQYGHGSLDMEGRPILEMLIEHRYFGNNPLTVCMRNVLKEYLANQSWRCLLGILQCTLSMSLSYFFEDLTKGSLRVETTELGLGKEILI